MRINYLIIFLLLLMAPICSLGAQEVEARPAVSEEEFQGKIEELGFNKTKKVLRLRERHKKKQKKEKQQTREIKSRNKGDGALLKLVSYAIMLGLFVLILYMVFSQVKLDKKIDPKLTTGELVDIEDINEVDADAAYKTAIASGDFRLAIRMQFIKCLQTLSAKEYIDWEKEKTNRDYARELSDSGLRQSFRELANVFEKTWYGEVATDRQMFQIYDQKFLSFFNSVK